jgi:hypothetical protein
MMFVACDDRGAGGGPLRFQGADGLCGHWPRLQTVSVSEQSRADEGAVADVAAVLVNMSHVDATMLLPHVKGDSALVELVGWTSISHLGPTRQRHRRDDDHLLDDHRRRDLRLFGCGLLRRPSLTCCTPYRRFPSRNCLLFLLSLMTRCLRSQRHSRRRRFDGTTFENTAAAAAELSTQEHRRSTLGSESRVRSQQDAKVRQRWHSAAPCAAVGRMTQT